MIVAFLDINKICKEKKNVYIYTDGQKKRYVQNFR